MPSPSPSPDPAELAVAVELAGDGFDGPVHAFAHDGHTLVVEQVGRVTDLDTGEVWLDLTDRVRSGGEQGLLGVDVHPDGGHWVAHWTAGDGATTLATYLVGADARPDPASEQVVLRVAQPARNHNGGTAMFGPDRRFWLALGDGGGANDQFGNGQDRSSLLGALLRLDLDDPSVARIPADNPFVGDQSGADEIWAYGLRNPYRVAFGDDQVYIADVGQNAVEEVTALRLDQAGANLGWPEVEGDRCFRDGCDPDAYEPADVTYTHDSTGGCSVIGGHVYDGDALPALGGHFLYADLCAGILRSVRADDGTVADQLDLTDQVGGVPQVTGIGGDVDGEALLTFADGRVLRLVPA
jgi:glucose/arabinose dehydrogenase